jgi:peroxiredoxin
VSQLRPKLPEIRARGAELIAIGSGTVRHASWFIDDQKIDFPVFTDPSLAAYREAGFQRSVLRLISPRAILNSVRAFSGGHRQESFTTVQGDAVQIGGVIIVDRAGEIVWRYASREAGDHPNPDEVVRAIERLHAAASS